MYFHPENVTQASRKIDSVVTLLPQLAGEAVAPPVNMYGKILLNSAQMVEPTTTDSRKTLLGGMEAAGASIVEELELTIESYQETEANALKKAQSVMKAIGGVGD